MIALPLVAVALVACGDDAPVDDAAGTLPPVETPATGAPPATSGRSYDVPTGADDVVISVVNEGGFVPVDLVFTRTPTALVTGDGRAIANGPVPAIYPGPLLPNLLERSISEAGVQHLVAEADRLGLLAGVDYPRNDVIADASDTVVTITVDGETYEHRAYALGLDDETDPARVALAEFVAAMSDLPATVGDGALGPEQTFESAAYLIQATPSDPATLDVDIEPTIVPWPQDAPVRLADAAVCAVLPADVGTALFDEATTLTFFSEADVTYAVAAVQQVPGRTC